MAKKVYATLLILLLALPAHAISDYNWYDYYLVEPSNEAPLILPMLPEKNDFNDKWSQGLPAHEALEFQIETKPNTNLNNQQEIENE